MLPLTILTPIHYSSQHEYKQKWHYEQQSNIRQKREGLFGALRIDKAWECVHDGKRKYSENEEYNVWQGVEQTAGSAHYVCGYAKQ